MDTNTGVYVLKVLPLAALMLVGLTNCEQPKTTDMKTEQITQQGQKEIIIDVRTPEEWNEDGHANCSVNYPLDQLESKLDSLKQYDKVTIVCRSGARAGAARNMLLSAGIKNVENLGPWQNIHCQ